MVAAWCPLGLGYQTQLPPSINAQGVLSIRISLSFCLPQDILEGKVAVPEAIKPLHNALVQVGGGRAVQLGSAAGAGGGRVVQASCCECCVPVTVRPQAQRI